MPVWRRTCAVPWEWILSMYVRGIFQKKEKPHAAETLLMEEFFFLSDE